MPKRKHIEISNGHSDDRALNIKCSRLKAKADQGNKSIATALKLARGFERQKLGRRQKTASSKNEHKELLRLREEVIVLKRLELNDVATKYLFRQMAKTKRVKEALAFVTLYGENPKIEGPPNGAEANVTGRLFNSNPVKEALPGIMNDIYGILGIEVEKKESGAGERASKEEDVRSRRTYARKSSEDRDFDKHFFNLNEEMDSDFESSVDLSTIPTIAELRAKAEANVKKPSRASRASQDDKPSKVEPDESLDESLDGSSTKGDIKIKRELSISPSPSLSLSASPSASTPIRFEPNNLSISKPSSKSNLTFLPSLMMGGYYSGSEAASSSDIDDPISNPHSTAHPRKNRRGQRARQKIAEAKFGAGAKHLASQSQSESKSRDSGWDSKRGATDTSTRNSRFGTRSKGPTGANGDTLGPSRRVKERPNGGKRGGDSKEGPLHPSWEAARKKKEQASLARGGFLGKKISFD